jgi:hypothetical protein
MIMMKIRLISKRQINYKKTYFEIDFNVHLMECYTSLRENGREIFNPFLALCCPDCLCSVPWAERPSLSVVIVSTQYCPSLALVVLLVRNDSESMQASTRT